MARPITFLSDYGHDDDFAGVCRAVIAGIAPDARLIDLTHGIRPQAVAEGAAILARGLPFAPPGIHLAVVDPGVGSGRRAVAARTAEEERILVGPDNGLLAPALERFGGAAAAVEISRSAFRLEPVSATFHGRDLFAPVAAQLALGRELEQVGAEVDPGSLTALERTEPTVEIGVVAAHVAYVDRFGNVTLDAGVAHLDRAGIAPDATIALEALGASTEAPLKHTFADVDEGAVLVYANSWGGLAVAVNRGSAAEALGLRPGADVTLRPA